MNEDILSLFSRVADLSAAERHAWFIENHTPPHLQAEVESLLQFDTTAGPLPADRVRLAARDLLHTAPPQPGLRCGPYELIREIGRGGMGTVFLAERRDGELNQRAAIKIGAHLPHDTAARLRFLQERQFLASLEHPGIARLLDAGHTANGLPYLVMEFVDGVPLDDYCRPLPLRRRLQLFLDICDSVAYAHRNLVIHRDLKPSNILVNTAGQPKLLDFGIARLLDAAPPATALTLENRLTLEYASPEQLRGNARTTATDIYSLGAILYRLLTGASPHRASNHVPIELHILNETPRAPSALDPALPRDLDFVTGKALRKEPGQRYPSVEALADDVRAVLEFRPVRARSGDAAYRFRRFVRRNWIPLAATASVMLFLAAALVIVARERAISERRFTQLRQFANQVLHLDPDIRDLPGATAARRKVVTISMQYLDALAQEGRADSSLALDLANGYLQLANVQGVPAYPNLGEFAQAGDSLAKADAFSRQAAASGKPDAILLAAEVAQSRMILSDVQRRDTGVLNFAAEAGTHLGRLAQLGAPAAAQVCTAVPMWLNIGQAYLNQHHYPEAVRFVKEGIDRSHHCPQTGQNGAGGMSLLANVLRQSGDLEGALTAITEARKLAETGTFPGEVQRRSVLYTVLWRQSQILWSEGAVSLDRPADALDPARRAFDLMDQLAAQDPKDSTSRARAGTAAWQLGDILRLSDPAQALAIYDRGIARQREISNSARARATEARLLALSAYPLLALHRTRDAQQRVRNAFDLLRQTHDYPAKVVRLGSEVEEALLARATVDRDPAATRELLDAIAAAKPGTGSDRMAAARLAYVQAALDRLAKNL